MNKYIETDLRNGKYYLYCGIMNIISELEYNNINEYDFGEYVPYSLLKDVLKERNWNWENEFETNGWEIDFWTTWISPQNKKYTVSGCFVSGGLNIRLLEDETN